MKQGCKIVLTRDNRAADWFVASDRGVQVARDAARLAARSLSRPDVQVVLDCGATSSVLTTCNDGRCTDARAPALGRARRRRRRRVR